MLKPDPVARATKTKTKRQLGSANGGSLSTWVRSVRFDYDKHGLRSAFVPVQDVATTDVSDLIAAAIHQSWVETADED